jgi:hypothetical protein
MEARRLLPLTYLPLRIPYTVPRYPVLTAPVENSWQLWRFFSFRSWITAGSITAGLCVWRRGLVSPWHRAREGHTKHNASFSLLFRAEEEVLRSANARAAEGERGFLKEREGPRNTPPRGSWKTEPFTLLRHPPKPRRVRHAPRPCGVSDERRCPPSYRSRTRRTHASRPVRSAALGAPSRGSAGGRPHARASCGGGRPSLTRSTKPPPPSFAGPRLNRSPTPRRSCAVPDQTVPRPG